MLAIDYVLAIALSHVGQAHPTADTYACTKVAEAHAALVESIASRGLVRLRAAVLACRALVLALALREALNTTALARQLARAEALRTFGELLRADAPRDPRALLSATRAAWGRAPRGVEECLVLAHAALRVAESFVEGEPVGWPIHDPAGRQLAVEMGRADLLSQSRYDRGDAAEGTTEAPTSGDRLRSPSTRLEVV